MLFEQLQATCQTLEAEFSLIPEKRKEKLSLLRSYIVQKKEQEKLVQLVVICTHNSRRSHIGQLWLAIGAVYYQLTNIATFSGGTEATALNERVVTAFQKLGLEMNTEETSPTNPVYSIKWQKDMLPYQAFSKKYQTAPNPSQDFGAILVCAEEDEGCPFVLGADWRLSLPYKDPKEFDGTALEAKQYEQKIKEIGRELLFVLSEIALG